jgi:hypothetical protein
MNHPPVSLASAGRNDIGGVCGVTYSVRLDWAFEGAFHPEVACEYVKGIRVGPILQSPWDYTRFM